MPPAAKAEKASAPPMPRRKSRRDHSSRKRSNCPSASLLLTFYPPVVNSPRRRVTPCARPGGRGAAGDRRDYGSRARERQSPDWLGHRASAPRNHLLKLTTSTPSTG